MDGRFNMERVVEMAGSVSTVSFSFISRRFSASDNGIGWGIVSVIYVNAQARVALFLTSPTSQEQEFLILLRTHGHICIHYSATALGAHLTMAS
jgi:hypothetical protein